jgi:hypothetical protein
MNARKFLDASSFLLGLDAEDKTTHNSLESKEHRINRYQMIVRMD